MTKSNPILSLTHVTEQTQTNAFLRNPPLPYAISSSQSMLISVHFKSHRDWRNSRALKSTQIKMSALQLLIYAKESKVKWILHYT